MKIHEKAKLYDELLKDYTELLNEMEKFKSELENLPNREDLVKEKENNLSSYYAMTTGSFSAMAFGLDIKLHKFKGVLNWYTRQNS
jgi:predicted nuclease with TOPRIM domain